jgi:hypothetical protein
MAKKKNSNIIERVGFINHGTYRGELTIDWSEGWCNLYEFDGNNVDAQTLRDYAEMFERAADLLEE